MIPENKLSIVIGTYNRKKYLKHAVQSIKSELTNCTFYHEIIVIDGGSDDGTIEWLIKQKDIVTIIQHNRGIWAGKEIERKSWGYFMNLGFKCARGKYICMLSDDCLVVPGAISNGIKLFDEQLKFGGNIGAVAFYFRDWPEQKKYSVNVEFDKIYVNHGIYLNKAIKKVGYIDEAYDFYNADIDLCLKLDQAGFKTIDSEKSFIEHLTHTNTKTRKSNNSKRFDDDQRILKKWLGIYYNKLDDLKDKRYSIEQEFTDKGKTYKYFFTPAVRLKLGLKKIYRRHFKGLNKNNLQ